MDGSAERDYVVLEETLRWEKIVGGIVAPRLGAAVPSSRTSYTCVLCVYVLDCAVDCV